MFPMLRRCFVCVFSRHMILITSPFPLLLLSSSPLSPLVVAACCVAAGGVVVLIPLVFSVSQAIAEQLSGALFCATRRMHASWPSR